MIKKMLGKSKPLPDEDGFYRAIEATRVTQNKATSLTIGGQPILVTEYQENYYAFSAYCPHAAGDLVKGQIYKGRIDCPDHGYRFDICSGKTMWPPDETYRLKTYPIKIIDGLLFIKITT